MDKINGIPRIPFGLLSGFYGDQEIRITELAEEGFCFRVPEKIEENACFELDFFDFSSDGYHKVQLTEHEREMELTKETPFFRLYSVRTEKKSYRKQVRRLVGEYDNYISLKLIGDDAYLSEKLVGYPAKKDEIYAENFEEQKKEWFCAGEENRRDTINQECFEEQKKEWFCTQGKNGKAENVAGCKTAWNHENRNLEKMPEFELAITIDRPELYQQFLEKDWESFEQDYWKRNFLKQHPLCEKKVTRIYIGNQFCHNLFPEKNQLFQMLEKAAENRLAVTLAFSYIRDSLLEETKELLQKLDLWCLEKERKYELEMIVNDWAMPALLKEKPHLKPVLGILLNKRRKDARLSYKRGYEDRVDSLTENNLNCGFYQDYLKNICNIERFEFESCGYPVKIPEGKHSLHMPFFQTNTSQYCTIYAVCKYGDRGRQQLPENCPRYCDAKVFLYPKHLNMVGRYNSLFGYDDTILWDEKRVKGYLEQGIDRIVMNLSL